MPRVKAIKTLAEIPASELALSARPLIQIDSSASLDDALTLLRHNNVLALPVFDSKKNKFVGIVSVSDILNYIAFFDFTRDGKIAEKFDNGSRPVSDLLGLSAESKRLWVTDVTDSIDDLLEPMSKGVHRILVRLPADQESHLPSEATSGQKSSETSLNDFAESQFRIVTQSDLLRFVCSRLDSLEGLKVPFNHSLKHLGLSSGKVSIMKSSETAIQGFSRMAKEEVSSLAVVDDDGRLVACLSVSDLRGITSNLISRLLLPVLDFLKEKNRGILPPVIAVTDQFSLKEVLTKMIVCRVHRIFIEDGFNFKPTGVITMTDIITTLYNNEYVQ